MIVRQSMGFWLGCLLASAVSSMADCPVALFKKGVELAERGRTTEALQVFREVTAKDSTCLEGWNNRAALEAATGDMFGSQRSLSKALNVRRDVQSVASNLEKLRSRMARLAYDSAFGTPSKLPPLQLALHKEIAKPSKSNPSVDADSLVRALSNARQEIAGLTKVRDSLLSSGRLAQLETGAESARSLSTAPPPPPPPAKSPASQATQTLPPPAPPPPTPPPPPPREPVKERSQEMSALETVRAWANAWSSQNVDAYLGFYGSTFEAPDRMSRQSWEARRRERILAPKAIHVEVVSPQVRSLGPDRAEVVYKQVYQTEDARLVLRKRIVLTKEGKEWKIVSEREAR